MPETPAAAHAALKIVRRLFRGFESERTQRDTGGVTATWDLNVSLTRDTLDGGWIAECDELPGCLSQGETEEEALNNLMDAIGGVVTARLHERVPELHGPDSEPHDEHHKIAIPL